jgi:hypothetical protein
MHELEKWNTDSAGFFVVAVAPLLKMTYRNRSAGFACACRQSLHSCYRPPLDWSTIDIDVYNDQRGACKQEREYSPAVNSIRRS